MSDPSYVAGAMTMAHSLKKMGTRYQVWCMVDASIPQDARALLAKVFTHVIEVPIIEHDSVPLKSEILQVRRGSWNNKSYTKWNVFNPEIFTVDGKIHNIETVMFVDADIVFLRNPDFLFDMETPAAMFANAWVKPYGNGPSVFGYLEHGKKVRKESLNKALGNSHLCDAGLVLLRPTGYLWQTFWDILHGRTVYGNPDCKGTPDEQILVETMIKVGATFHAIHQKYNWPVGKPQLIIRNEIPDVYHFRGPKPWQNPEKIADDDERLKAKGYRKLGYYSAWEINAREVLELYGTDYRKYVDESPMILDELMAHSANIHIGKPPNEDINDAEINEPINAVKSVGAIKATDTSVQNIAPSTRVIV